jgi:glutamate-1-semialdehyde 2,1-aminomutase
MEMPDTSKDIWQRSQSSLPGGVNSPVRAFSSVEGEPIFAKRGEGAFIEDVEGRRYLDLIGSWGPMILGHCHERVVQAVKDQVEEGMSFGLSTEVEVELAELVKEAFPTIEKLRLVNSGTEAVMSALRLARGFTKRPLIVKFEGCYHGHADHLLVSAGSGLATHGQTSSAGVPDEMIVNTRVLPFNDEKAIKDLFEKEGSQIAAVIVEPVAINMGLILPKKGFLEMLRDECGKNRSLLVFDEVVTGFRLSLGGAQETYKIPADITVLGKVIGGGLPIGAYGARVEIMDHLSPLGPVYQAGTLSGNPIATASGLATIQELKTDPPYKKLEELGALLRRELASEVEKFGYGFINLGSMATLFFGKGPFDNFVDVKEKCDFKKFGRFHLGMRKRGVLLPMSQFETWFLSKAHTEEDVLDVASKAKEVLKEIS